MAFAFNLYKSRSVKRIFMLRVLFNEALAAASALAFSSLGLSTSTNSPDSIASSSARSSLSKSCG